MNENIHCRNCSEFQARCDYCLLEKKWAEKYGREVCAPGSPGSIHQRCVCPRLDNGNGSGSYKGGYIVRGDCPLHGEGPEFALETIVECPECNSIRWFIGTYCGDTVRLCGDESCDYWSDI